MSIILRALKKIQNQKAEQAPAETENEGSPDPSSQALNDVFASNEERPLLETDQPADKLPGSTAPAAAEMIKSSRITRVLLGVLVALGLLTTAWFATRIYGNYKAPAPGGLQAKAVTTDHKAPAKQVTKKEIAAPVPSAPADVAAGPADASPPPAVVQEQAAAQPEAMSSEPPPQAEQPRAIEPAPQPVELSPPAPAGIAPAIQESAVKEAGRVSVASAAAVFPPVGTEAVTKEAQPQQGERPELKVNAIAWRAMEPKAIVNMQRVYVGDVIEGATVKEIRRKSIVFEYAGEEYEIRF